MDSTESWDQINSSGVLEGMTILILIGYKMTGLIYSPLDLRVGGECQKNSPNPQDIYNLSRKLKTIITTISDNIN